MSIIARLIVTGTGTKKNRKLFDNFIAESKAEGSKHTFILLPGGFLTFKIKDSVDHIPLIEPANKAEKKQRNANIELVQQQALQAFHDEFDTGLLKDLKSVAEHLVTGIDGFVRGEKHPALQFVLIHDLQTGKPLTWTGKTFPTDIEQDILIQMPIVSHFQKIAGKKVAVFMCNDLAIFNQRIRYLCSPFSDERYKSGEKWKRQDNNERGKLKCDFIDEALAFRPAVVLHLPHTEGTWKQKFTQYNNWLAKGGSKMIQHYASGIRDNEKYPLSGTQDGDVKTFTKQGWEE